MVHITNQEIAKILFDVSNLLEIEEIKWKPLAYRNAARTISELQEELTEIYRVEGSKGIDNIPGVGKHITQKIVEIIETGKLSYLQDLKKKIPVKIDELMRVEGLGPKKILLLYKKIRVKDLETLEKAAKSGKIAKLPRMGKKTEENLLRAISFVKKTGRRKLLDYAEYLSDEIIFELKKRKEIEKIQVCGSLARKKDTIGDIDILVVTKNPLVVMENFTKLKHVSEVIAKGVTKSSVIYEDMQVDLRTVQKESFGSAVQYFVGSKEHNVALRRIAMSKGFKLNEYGLYKGETREEGENEEKLYNKLGMDWIPFELRENSGEIQAAIRRKLPNLIKKEDIRGDLHIHTHYSDGLNTIKEMVEAAIKLKHEYIAITDHTGYVGITNSMNDNKIEKQRKEIERLRKIYSNIEILHGAEVDIKLNGGLSISPNSLKKLDIVLGAIHSGFRRSKREQTQRLIKAMDKSNIIVHPTGRLLLKREGYELDFDEIYENAKNKNVALEINSFPDRMDLNDVHIREAVRSGVKLSIGTDSHETEHMENYRLGIYNARRGWCEKGDVINTMDFKNLKKFIKRG